MAHWTRLTKDSGSVTYTANSGYTLDLIVSRSPPVMEHQQATQERSPSLSIV